MMLHHLDAAGGVVLAYNPFDGVTPSWGPFAGILTTKVGMFLGIAWAIGFVYCAYNLVVSIAKLSKATKGGYGDSLDESKGDALKAAAAVVGLTALPVIYGVLAT